MTAALLIPPNIVALKAQARKLYPSAMSSHLSEALAAGVGFKTHAALLAKMDSSAFGTLAAELSSVAFHHRLLSLAGAPPSPTSMPDIFCQDMQPLRAWYSNQDDAAFFRHDKLGLPFICIRYRKRKYCTIDWDHHISSISPVRDDEGYDVKSRKAVYELMRSCQRIANELNCRGTIFGGTYLVGQVTKVPIEIADAFIEAFSLAYYSMLSHLINEGDTGMEMPTS